ncbi:MAG: M20 family metallo-hydrolase [Clostridiales bacterium]|nr:M20 family metallo-hydrolase [Clostridiales bacterium]
MKTSLDRIKSDIVNLGEFNSTPGEGLTRFSLTDEDKSAREYLRKELEKLNLEIYEDAAGTLFGKRAGTDPDLPVIMIGSHFDSVKNGGNFDGPAGVIMALETMRVLEENNIQTKYPIEFVAMIEEEGGRFGSGVFGSRAMAGLVDYEQLKRNKDENGISMAEAFESFGFDPKKIESAKRDPKKIKAFIELHIEQGPILETKKIDVGIVDFIVGINEFKIIVTGRPDHAGTTPMNMRADALDIASKVISKINTYPIPENNGTVATVGVLTVLPNAANIIPGKVSFTVDVRSKNAQSIKNVKNKIVDSLNELTKESAVEYEIIDMLDVNPVEMDPTIINLFKSNATSNDFSYEIMMSGAGHDAMIMGSITNVGLIFVPSKDGRSHCPEEWTDYDDLQKGIELICNTVIQMGVAE